jgi:hypothetical protein
MSVKSALSVSAVLLLGGMALTACSAGSSGTTAGSASGAQPSASASAASPVSPSSPAPSGTAAAASAWSPSASAAANGNGGGSGSSAGSQSSGGGNNSAGYAYTHPCSMAQLSVHVTGRSGAPSQRVIEVRNLGASSCGLSYYPLVSLDNANSANGGQAVLPLVPGGLGGAPAYPVYAGQTAYAVIDLDPSGATTGTAAGVNELNVLADGDHMPNADTVNVPLGSGALVLKPKLGLYRSNTADAVASMTTANTVSS